MRTRLAPAAVLLFGLAAPVLAQPPQGSIISWGNNQSGQVTQTPTGSDFTQLAAGDTFSVALKSDGSIVSWGQTGVTNQTPSGLGFTQIAAHATQALALKSDGSIVSWGSNRYGQVSQTPTSTGFTQIAAGYGHSLALKSDGSIISWGWDTFGQVSNTPTGTGFKQIAAGDAFSLALTANGSIVSWGHDPNGVVSNAPTGTGFTQVAGGGAHALALRSDSSIVSWGNDSEGQVSQTPTGSPFGPRFMQVASESYTSVALRFDGLVVSWGRNRSGQVSQTPTRREFAQVAAGHDHSLALRAPYSGTFTPFGTGCAGTAGLPVLAPQGGSLSLPKVGGNFFTTVTPLGSLSFPVGLLGASNTTWSGLSLPLELTPIGMPGCNIYVSVDLSMRLSVSGNSATWNLPIPSRAVLLGESFYQQVFIIDPGGSAVSNAGTATIGF